MYCTTESILMAEHEAITKAIEYSDRESPEDYAIERIRGIHLMIETLLHMEKEGN